MMKIVTTIIQAGIAACFVITVGGVGLRIFYVDRVPPHVYIGAFPVGGVALTQLSGSLVAYQQQLSQTPITITFRGRRTVHTFQDLGITLNQDATQQKIVTASRTISVTSPVRISPVLNFQDNYARAILSHDFIQALSLPKDAALTVDNNYHVLITQSASGEDFDMVALDDAITKDAGMQTMASIPAISKRADPAVTEKEVAQVQEFAQKLAQTGFHITYQEKSFLISRANIAKMIRFVPSPSAHVAFDGVLLKEYIDAQIVPEVHVDPVNARFQMQDGKVQQFALPKNGIDVDEQATIQAIADALVQSSDSAQIITTEVQPAFTDVVNSKALGIDKLLATGETDFVGSPKNRKFNIGVGAEKYNGILVAPGEEFSFVKLLGPVDKEAGYLPELVIKNNATIPEYGGGLCQVSTTAFRAAMLAGVKITERHNHSYAVRYYGTPGFDATIYPPYTDFRFLNNTPGYLLIQTHIDGTKLFFEFWGTDDGRQVEIDGPHPYNRMPDGAVKSVLKRTVTDKDGNVIDSDTFNSNYKSPTLFPHEPAKQATNTTSTTAGEISTNGNA
ncbi:MAG: VanW family protein [Candidatus Andersenbacteria bacterium]